MPEYLIPVAPEDMPSYIFCPACKGQGKVFLPYKQQTDNKPVVELVKKEVPCPYCNGTGLIKVGGIGGYPIEVRSLRKGVYKPLNIKWRIRRG